MPVASFLAGTRVRGFRTLSLVRQQWFLTGDVGTCREALSRAPQRWTKRAVRLRQKQRQGEEAVLHTMLLARAAVVPPSWAAAARKAQRIAQQRGYPLLVLVVDVTEGGATTAAGPTQDEGNPDCFILRCQLSDAVPLTNRFLSEELAARSRIPAHVADAPLRLGAVRRTTLGFDAVVVTGTLRTDAEIVAAADPLHSARRVVHFSKPGSLGAAESAGPGEFVTVACDRIPASINRSIRLGELFVSPAGDAAFCDHVLVLDGVTLPPGARRTGPVSVDSYGGHTVGTLVDVQPTSVTIVAQRRAFASALDATRAFGRPPPSPQAPQVLVRFLPAADAPRPSPGGGVLAVVRRCWSRLDLMRTVLAAVDCGSCSAFDDARAAADCVTDLLEAKGTGQKSSVEGIPLCDAVTHGAAAELLGVAFSYPHPALEFRRAGTAACAAQLLAEHDQHFSVRAASMAVARVDVYIRQPRALSHRYSRSPSLTIGADYAPTPAWRTAHREPTTTYRPALPASESSALARMDEGEPAFVRYALHMLASDVPPALRDRAVLTLRTLARRRTEALYKRLGDFSVMAGLLQHAPPDVVVAVLLPCTFPGIALPRSALAALHPPTSRGARVLAGRLRPCLGDADDFVPRCAVARAAARFLLQCWGAEGSSLRGLPLLAVTNIVGFAAPTVRSMVEH